MEGILDTQTMFAQLECGQNTGTNYFCKASLALNIKRQGKK